MVNDENTIMGGSTETVSNYLSNASSIADKFWLEDSRSYISEEDLISKIACCSFITSLNA